MYAIMDLVLGRLLLNLVLKVRVLSNYHKAHEDYVVFVHPIPLCKLRMFANGCN